MKQAGWWYTVFLMLILSTMGNCTILQARSDTTNLRVSLHIFQNNDGFGNFNPDSIGDSKFLVDVVEYINFRLMNLDTLKPAVPSPYIKSLDIQIRLDSIFYHSDNYAWDCSESIESDYMRRLYVDSDSSLNYRQKFRTLPIFLGGNYNIVGGHNSLIGDKWFIAMRGMYSEYLSRPYQSAVRDCGRGLLHELGHSLGLSHNFKDGPHGQQCDRCEDNGCPEEGSSNNIMDYWPSYGYAISACQKEIVWEHLNGLRGNISEIVLNDSCFREEDQVLYIKEGESISISDTSYIHSDLVVKDGGRLVVNSYLSVPGGCSIFIEPGAELIVENGTLGNLCGDIWGGVVIMRGDSASGGRVSFNTARIKHARTGIITEGHVELEIRNSDFINNLSAIRIMGWMGKEDIRDCRFEISNKLNHWEEGLVPESFVWLKDVENIVFTNCTFYNSEGHRNYGDLYSGIGVVAENSSLDLNSCKFENLFKGIIAGSDSLGNFLSVDSCFFAYNHCSIQLAALSKAKISSSSFNLNRLNTVPVYGVFARKTNYLEIELNNFYSDYGGDNLTAIVSDLEYPGTHLIHNNNFSLVNEGIVVFNSENTAQWPVSLIDYSYPDLKEVPIGSVWYSNHFDKVKKQIVSVDSVGGGLLKSIEREYQQYSVAWSEAFDGEGYGSYAISGDICIVKPPPEYERKKSAGILFHILTDKSWSGFDSIDLEHEHSPEVFYKLVDEYVKGMDFLNRNISTSHQGMVSLASHIKKYPWIVYTSQFAQYLDRDIYKIPAWVWNEVFEALVEASWWKTQIYQFIISLARDQIDVMDNGNSNFDDGFLEEFSEVIFKELNAKISTDIGRLNPGVFSSSSVPGFIVVPNPARDRIGVKFDYKFPEFINNRGLDWIVRDMFGKVISRGYISDIENLIIDAEVIPSGSYLIEIWNKNEFLGRQKFIILPD